MHFIFDKTIQIKKNTHHIRITCEKQDCLDWYPSGKSFQVRVGGQFIVGGDVGRVLRLPKNRKGTIKAWRSGFAYLVPVEPRTPYAVAILGLLYDLKEYLKR